MSLCITTSGFQMLYVPPPGPPLNLSATPSGGGGPAAPTNFQLTHQGPNDAVLSWDPVPGASSYQIWRFTDSGGGGSFTRYATTASSPYTDTAATNITTPGPTLQPYIPATVYRYALSALSGSGESAIQTQCDLWVYRAGTDFWNLQTNNLNYGGATCNTGNTTNLQAGSSANILATASPGGAFQPRSGDPFLHNMTPTQDAAELGGFDFLNVDIYFTVTGQLVQIDPISRITTGDNFNGIAILLGDPAALYGPPSTANTWCRYKVPLALLGVGFGTMTYSLSGATMTVTAVTGPGLQGSAYLRGPGLTPGTGTGPSTAYVLATNPGNPSGNPSNGGAGTYQIAPAQGSAPAGSVGVYQRTNFYKSGFIDANASSQRSFAIDNWHFSTY